MSRFPRPFSSLHLNTEEVNQQVPEMSVTGFGCREVYLNIPVEVGPRLVLPYSLISTYELDFPDNFVHTARPSICREDRSPDVSPSLPESLTRIGLVETASNNACSEDGLKKLLACGPLKSSMPSKKTRKRVKKVDASEVKIEDKLQDSDCEIYGDVEEHFEKTMVLSKTNEERSTLLSKKKGWKINFDGDKHTQSLQYVTIVCIVPNAAQIVLEVERISTLESKWDSEFNMSSCKSYVLHSQSYMPRSFKPIILQFPGINLIKEHDLCRNYVFYHVILQRLNKDDDSDHLMPTTEALCFKSEQKECQFRSRRGIPHSADCDTSCFLLGRNCSKEDLMLKSKENLGHGSRIVTTPKNSGQRSRVRSSRTFTKVVHNWWDPTPPKKIKRYLSPDSVTSEKPSTSGSETYWDYYDMGNDHGKDTVMRKSSLIQFKQPVMAEDLSKCSDSSGDDKFVKHNLNRCKDNLFNYYTFCSEAPQGSSYESVDSQDSFDEDSLNESTDSSVSLKEVCWNNKLYYVPSSSKQFSQDIGTRDTIFENVIPHYHGRSLEFSFVTGAKRTNNSETTSRIYSEETTTVLEVEAQLKSSESSSVCFQSTSTVTKQGQNYKCTQNAYEPMRTSLSVEGVQISTKNRIALGDNKFNAKGSLKPDYKAHRSKLPQISNIKAKCNKVPGVSTNNELNHKSYVLRDCNQCCVNSSFSNEKFSSQLPILQQKPVQASKAKKPHWTTKTPYSKHQSCSPKINLEGRKKQSDYKKMHENLRVFAKAPVSKDANLFNFPRKLSPIAASESMSCSKSFSSERSIGYDNINTSFVDELENVEESEEMSTVSGDCPYEIEIDRPEIGGCVRQKRRAFLTCRIPKERTYANRFVLPNISVGKNRQQEKFGSRYEQRMKFSNAVKEVVTRIATKKNYQPEHEPYNLYRSAEEQMLKLLEPEKETPKPVSSPETPPTPVSPPSFTSDNSAFTKFEPIKTPSPLFITEDVNVNEADAKSRRSSEKSDSPLTITYCDNQSRKDSNENPITLSMLSLCSSVSIESVESNKNGYRMPCAANSAKVEKRTTAPLRRSLSAFESRKETPSRKTSKGNPLKMEDMLYGPSNVEGERYFGSESVNSFLHDSGSVGSLEKPVSDVESLNNAEQELLKSMSEFEKIFCSTTSSPDQSSQTLKFPSLLSSFPIETPDRFLDIELQPAHPGNNGSDSAYSSLNRKSPVGGGGEGGARFCHECGAKYPLTAAKFCCQCGVRRLIL